MLGWVLERKSCQDLVSSIQNQQRFFKQKHWLRQCGLEVLYLVEGNPDRLNMARECGWGCEEGREGLARHAVRMQDEGKRADGTGGSLVSRTGPRVAACAACVCGWSLRHRGLSRQRCRVCVRSVA